MLFPPFLKIGSLIKEKDGRTLIVTGERETEALGLRELHVISEEKSEFLVRYGTEEPAPLIDEWVWQWSLVRGKLIK